MSPPQQSSDFELASSLPASESAITEAPGSAAWGTLKKPSLADRSKFWRRYTHWAFVRPIIEKYWRIEEARAGVFMPVFLGIGIGLYFALAKEPALLTGPAILVAILAIAIATKQQGRVLAPTARWLLIIGFVIATGFSVASLRTRMVGAPMVDREMRFADIQGTLLAVEHRSADWRLLIAPNSIEGLEAEQLPVKIRVTWRGKQFEGKPGQNISLRASLSPPPPPAMPGGYDFGRYLFFQQIGAVGFSVSTPLLTPGVQGRSSLATWTLWVETIRLGLFNRIQNAAPGQGGAIVAAIVTGKREAISAGAEQSLRDSGLAHLLAISGLHMGLATGLIFFGTRFVLAMVPSLALRFAIKKWAALLALAGGLSYLILSGSGVSAQRAFAMTSIIFIAILTDRRALSLRNVAIAATLILVLTPEALLHPGFQMSFAAVTALIAAYEWYGARKHARRDDNKNNKPYARHKSLLRTLWRYGVGVAATDTIAAAATAPFALYHFHRTALYSLPANLLAMPVMAFWIMPAIICAALLIPFGLDGFGWRFAASGVDFILYVGATVSGWPGAVSIIPGQSISWLIIITLGGTVLLLSKAPWRLVGLIALPVVFLQSIFIDKPDLLITADGRNTGLAWRTAAQREFVVYDRRRDRFSVDNWMEDLGLDPERQKPVRMNERFACDLAGCIVTMPTGLIVAITQSPQSLGEDCQRANLVIAHFPVNRRLKGQCKAHLIDRRDAWNKGAQSIWISKSGAVRVRSVSETRSGRPWGGKVR